MSQTNLPNTEAFAPINELPNHLCEAAMVVYNTRFSGGKESEAMKEYQAEEGLRFTEEEKFRIYHAVTQLLPR